MSNFLEFASKRRSIRKFEDKDIPLEDIKYFISAAISAPSGCNSQCWKFVAIKDRQIIHKIEEAVIKKTESILAVKSGELSHEYLSSRRKLSTFFAKAPVNIAVFMTAAKYFDPTLISAFKDCGYQDEAIMRMYGNYDLLSIGAAVQNMLLAIHEKGYGACWMNDPVIAGEEINKILGEPAENRFISLIPIGFPAYSPRDKKMKDLSEVLSIK